MTLLARHCNLAYPLPIYPLKSPELTTSETDLQEGYRQKALRKIHEVIQTMLKVKPESKSANSVENQIKSYLSQRDGLKEMILSKLLLEKTELQEKIDQVQKWECDQFFKDMKTSGQRFELESIRLCMDILELL
jgi:collagenase-like PrtC family protease